MNRRYNPLSLHAKDKIGRQLIPYDEEFVPKHLRLHYRWFIQSYNHRIDELYDGKTRAPGTKR